MRHEMPATGRLVGPLVLSAAAAALLYGVLAALGDVDAIAGTAAAMGAATWAAVLGMSLVNYALRCVRWQGYLGRLGHAPSPSFVAASYMAGFAFTTTPGKAGEAVRSVYLNRVGVGWESSLAALFAERVLDFFVIALLGLCLLPAFGLPLWPWTALLGVLLLPALARRPALAGLMNRLRGLGGDLSGRPRALLERCRQLASAARTLFSPAALSAGFVLGLVAWGAEGVAFHWILTAVGVDASLAAAIGVYALGTLIGALSFVPGGLGSTEAAMVYFLTRLGADPTEAIAATLICRLCTLWFAVALGGLAVLGLAIAGRTARGADAKGRSH